MKPITKKIQARKEYFVQFTDEELAELKMEEGQKYTMKVEDGTIKLTPYVKMEINMDEWPRETLEYLIQESCERDVSVNEVINDVLRASLEQFGCCSGCCDEV